MALFVPIRPKPLPMVFLWACHAMARWQFAIFAPVAALVSQSPTRRYWRQKKSLPALQEFSPNHPVLPAMLVCFVCSWKAKLIEMNELFYLSPAVGLKALT